MHTVWVRLNAVVFFGLTVLLGLSCMAAISKIGHASKYQPSKFPLKETNSNSNNLAFLLEKKRNDLFWKIIFVRCLNLFFYKKN